MMDLLRFPFTGFGVMPLAKHPSMKAPIGFHLDIRDVSCLPKGVVQARWLAIPKNDGGNFYLDLNQRNMARYGLLE